jgi:hypothetical protein
LLSGEIQFPTFGVLAFTNVYHGQLGEAHVLSDTARRLEELNRAIELLQPVKLLGIREHLLPPWFFARMLSLPVGGWRTNSTS